jgi:hypothetical protein
VLVLRDELTSVMLQWIYGSPPFLLKLKTNWFALHIFEVINEALVVPFLYFLPNGNSYPWKNVLISVHLPKYMYIIIINNFTVKTWRFILISINFIATFLIRIFAGPLRFESSKFYFIINWIFIIRVINTHPAFIVAGLLSSSHLWFSRIQPILRQTQHRHMRHEHIKTMLFVVGSIH